MKKIVALGAGIILVIVGALAYSVLKPPAEASGPIEAVPLEVEQAAEPTAVSETAVSDQTQPEPPAATDTPEGTSTDPAESSDAVPAETGLTIFVISQDESQVRFELDEDLRGNRITVVGTTNQVAGEIALDTSNPASAEAGVITINARTLATDSSFRNRAINNRILNTDAYEFITFTPTAVTGLPDTIAVGETIQFTIVGDLTIRDITNEVTFDVEASLASESQLVGTASTVVTRAAYNLVIPSVRDVANVEEEVELYINFTAYGS